VLQSVDRIENRTCDHEIEGLTPGRGHRCAITLAIYVSLSPITVLFDSIHFFASFPAIGVASFFSVRVHFFSSKR